MFFLLEQQANEILHVQASPPMMIVEGRGQLRSEVIEPMISRDLKQKGMIEGEDSFTMTLIGWVEMNYF